MADSAIPLLNGLAKQAGLVDRAKRAISHSHSYFRDAQHPDGYWWGEFGIEPHDGGRVPDAKSLPRTWPATPQISAQLTSAREFILSRGGVPKTRVFTKIWLALFGQWDWSGTPNLPPELILLPSWAPFNIYEFSSWARATIVPMSIILTERPYCPVPDDAGIDELYPHGHWTGSWSTKKQTVPGEAFSRRGFIRLLPLHHAGEDEFSDALNKGFDGFDSFAIEDEETCTVQACVSPVWDTCLAQVALLESGLAPDDPMVQSSTRWLVNNQILEEGDWSVRAKGNAARRLGFRVP
ncbi:Dammaradiene synthase [Geodia barretti]|uniref:Dammaradiene synthase n=1 Tax=Geodia barretti TaxID=519541 RepID=A0AA35R6Z0_GEOBA|nr:Dammaradiene synthase [Geodia barretti]